MPTIAEVQSARIMMFQRDHNPAHFHAFGKNFEAKFAILPFEMMEVRGKLRARERAAITRWALANQAELLENWLRAQRGERILKITG